MQIKYLEVNGDRGMKPERFTVHVEILKIILQDTLNEQLTEEQIKTNI